MNRGSCNRTAIRISVHRRIARAYRVVHLSTGRAGVNDVYARGSTGTREKRSVVNHDKFVVINYAFRSISFLLVEYM